MGAEPAAFLARLGVMGFSQIGQGLPKHHHLHLSKKLLPLCLLLGFGQIVSREAELLAA